MTEEAADSSSPRSWAIPVLAALRFILADIQAQRREIERRSKNDSGGEAA